MQLLFVCYFREFRWFYNWGQSGCSPAIIYHLSMNVNEALPFQRIKWSHVLNNMSRLNDDSFVCQLTLHLAIIIFWSTTPLINILTALMLVTSTAPFVVVSDVTTRGRSRDALSTGNVLAKQSRVMIGTHSSECWIQAQCKHSATAQLQRAVCVRYPRSFLLWFP